MPFLDDLRRFGPDASYDEVSPREARDYCARLTASHYENFSVVTWLTPRPLRPAFASIYAFCRWSDDLGDEVGDRDRSRTLLDWWRGQLLDLYQGHAHHPVMIALAPTVDDFSIPIDPFLALISAFEQDQDVTEYATYSQLLDYCTRSANPVGHLVLYLARAFNADNARLSDLTCTGLQLANFWQDVARDLSIGRIYLPREDRDRFGYPDADLRALRFTPAFADLLRFEVGESAGAAARRLAARGEVAEEAGGRRRPVHAGRPGDPRPDRRAGLRRALLASDGSARRRSSGCSHARCSPACCDGRGPAGAREPTAEPAGSVTPPTPRTRGRPAIDSARRSRGGRPGTSTRASSCSRPTAGGRCARSTPSCARPTTSPTSRATVDAKRAWRRSTPGGRRLEQRRSRGGRPAGWPGWPALADTVARHGIPVRYLHEVIDGVEMDLNPRPFATFDDLYAYCYRVASAVGLSCLHIWGFRSEGGRAERLAEACGLALQLTNILRDVREDALNGRVYLPEDDLRRFGVTPADLSAAETGEAVRRLLAFEASRAYDYYDRSSRPLSRPGRPGRAGRSCWRSSGSIDSLAHDRRSTPGVGTTSCRDWVSVPVWRKAAIVVGRWFRRGSPGPTTAKLGGPNAVSGE